MSNDTHKRYKLRENIDDKFEIYDTTYSNTVSPHVAVDMLNLIPKTNKLPSKVQYEQTARDFLKLASEDAKFEELTELVSLTVTKDDLANLILLERFDDSGIIDHIIELVCGREQLDIKETLKTYE